MIPLKALQGGEREEIQGGKRKEEENAASTETPRCKGDALLFTATKFSVFMIAMPIATKFKAALSGKGKKHSYFK